MKKYIVSAAAIFLLAGLTGCGSGNNAAAETKTVVNSENESANASGDSVVELQIGQTAAEGSIWIQASERFAELAAEKSGGTIKMDIYPSGQLGSQTDLYDQMYAGAPVIGVGTPAYFADMGAPDFGIMAAPYLVTDWDGITKLQESEWFAEQEKLMEDGGIKVLNFDLRVGTRETLTTKPIEKLADLHGKKIRVPNAVVYINTYTSLGANPVPMNLGEVYTSLQQGVIEGEDNTLSTMQSEKHYEVAKYLSMDHHIYDVQCFCMSSSVFQSMSEAQQKALLEAADEAADYFNELAREADEATLKDMEANGVTITYPDLSEYQKAAASFYENPAVNANWSENLYDKLMEIVNK